MENIITKNFNSTVCDFFKDEADEVWLTREQIGMALGYANPREAIKQLHHDHRDRLDKFSVQTKENTVKSSMGGNVTPIDNLQSTVTYYSPRGVMEICRWSAMPKANDFMDWVWDIVEAYRRKEIVLSAQGIAQLQEQYTSLQKSLEDLTKKYDNNLLETQARLDAIDGGTTYADTHEAFWVHTTYEQVKRLADKRDMSVADCLSMLVEMMDESRQLDYTYAEMARDYRTHHPGQKVERLAVLAENLDTQMAFEYILENEMDYWDVLSDDEKRSREILSRMDDYESPREHEIDTTDPGFLAAMAELDRQNKEEEERLRCRNMV